MVLNGVVTNIGCMWMSIDAINAKLLELRMVLKKVDFLTNT